jgi:hypothetical protein
MIHDRASLQNLMLPAQRSTALHARHHHRQHWCQVGAVVLCHPSQRIAADLAWWTDEALVVSRSSGDLFVIAVHSSDSAFRVVSSVERLAHPVALAVTPHVAHADALTRSAEIDVPAGAPLLALQREDVSNAEQQVCVSVR